MTACDKNVSGCLINVVVTLMMNKMMKIKKREKEMVKKWVKKYLIFGINRPSISLAKP